jgi:hypothetical protein
MRTLCALEPSALPWAWVSGPGARIDQRMHRKPAHLAIVVCLLLATQLHAASHNPVARRLDAILSTPDLARGFWGIEVVSLDNGKILYTQNADKLFTPASNTMLSTTAAALALIGPNYSSRTTVETSGVLHQPTIAYWCSAFTTLRSLFTIVLST